MPGSWGGLGEGSGHWRGFLSLLPALLPASLPLTACTEVPGTCPLWLHCPGVWVVVFTCQLSCSTSAHTPIPTPVSSLPSPSFPSFSVMRRGHHSPCDLLPPQPAFFETSLSASAPCKDFFTQAQAFSSQQAGWGCGPCGHSGNHLAAPGPHAYVSLEPPPHAGGFPGSSRLALWEAVWRFLIVLFMALTTGIKLVVQGLT